jgi:hypothetical protein
MLSQFKRDRNLSSSVEWNYLLYYLCCGYSISTRTVTAATARTHIPHPEVSHYEFWEFGEIWLAIAKRIFQFFV